MLRKYDDPEERRKREGGHERADDQHCNEGIRTGSVYENGSLKSESQEKRIGRASADFDTSSFRATSIPAVAEHSTLIAVPGSWVVRMRRFNSPALPYDWVVATLAVTSGHPAAYPAQKGGIDSKACER
jgi:hypothetical protein